MSVSWRLTTTHRLEGEGFDDAVCVVIHALAAGAHSLRERVTLGSERLALGCAKKVVQNDEPERAHTELLSLRAQSRTKR